MRRPYMMHMFVLVSLVMAGVLWATAGYAATITVRVASAKAASGEEVEIPITVEGASGIGAVQLELTYDPSVLEAQAVEKGALVGDNTLLDFNVAEPGRLIVGLVTLDGVDGDGDLLVTKFLVTGETDQKSPLGLENVQAWEGETRLDVLVTAESGEFTVSAAGLPLPLPLLVAILLGVLGLLLLLIILRRRQPQPAVVQPAPAPPRAGLKFCTQCGAQLEAGKRFCTKCGHPVSR